MVSFIFYKEGYLRNFGTVPNMVRMLSFQQAIYARPANVYIVDARRPKSFQHPLLS